MYEEMVERPRNNADHYMTVEGAARLVHLIIDAADAIETLSKQVELEHQSGFADGQIAANCRKPHWIPVTERLPEMHEKVLVCNKYYGETGLGISTVAVRDGSDWICAWDMESRLNFITHWMPMPPAPEPPKEDA